MKQEQYFKVVSIDELPKETDWYLMKGPFGGIHTSRGLYDINEGEWINDKDIQGCTHWLKPCTLSEIIGEQKNERAEVSEEMRDIMEKYTVQRTGITYTTEAAKEIQQRFIQPLQQELKEAREEIERLKVTQLPKWTYKGYSTTVQFSVEDRVFHGKLEGISDLVSFEGKSLDKASRSFQEAVKDYIETKKELES